MSLCTALRHAQRCDKRITSLHRVRVHRPCLLNTMTSNTILRSPAAERNKQPLLKVLVDVLPSVGPVSVLEIAAGTGQHACFFAENLPSVTWQPTEIDHNSLNSIRGYTESLGVRNVLAPLHLDVRDPPPAWASGSLRAASHDLVLCVNMTHISAWTCTQGLFAGSSVYLKPGGALLVYGPYKHHGMIAPESNVQFDLMLRQQNSEWGLRDLDDLEELAKSNGMVLEKVIDMPANNKSALFRKL